MKKSKARITVLTFGALALAGLGLGGVANSPSGGGTPYSMALKDLVRPSQAYADGCNNMTCYWNAQEQQHMCKYNQGTNCTLGSGGSSCQSVTCC